MPSFPTIIFGLVGLAFGGVGLFFLVTGLVNLARGIAARNWPWTEGTVTASRVAVDSEKDDGNGRTISNNQYRYNTEIVYEYEVGARRYTGTRVSFADTAANNPHALQKIVDRYPINARPRVFYKPSSPDKSLLEPGISAGSFTPLILGPGLIGFSALIIVVGTSGPEAIFNVIDPSMLAHVIPPAGMIGGAGAIFLGLRARRLAAASMKWPSVRGIVAASDILRQSSSSSGSSGRISTDTYKPEIAFRYVVNDREYVSNTISFGDYASGNIGHAESVTATYPVGGEVEVFYDPADPSNAVLERRTGAGGCLFFAVGIIFLVISTFFWFIRGAFTTL